MGNLLADLPAPPAGKSGWPWTEAGPRPDPAAEVALPAVAIVTPSFQQGEFLEETIRSVLLQGYPRLTYALMDGGSTDGSLAIIQKYAPWLDAWVSEPDGGQAAAIDKGFAQIDGEILGWLNSDDVLEPGAIWTAVDEFRRNPGAVLVYGNAEMIGRDGSRRGRVSEVKACDRNFLLTTTNAIAQPAAFFRRAAYETAGRLDHGLYWALDYDLWIRLASQGALRYVPRTLAQTRIYPEAKTSQRTPAMFDEIKAVAERYGGHGLPAEMAVAQEITFRDGATDALRAGDLAAAVQQLASLVNQVPEWRSAKRLAAFLADMAWWRIREAGQSVPTTARWIGQVCRSLPDTYLAPQRLERQVLGLLFEGLAFHSYHHGHTGEGLRYAARAIAQDQRRAANRGLWAITVRSLVKKSA